MRFPSREEVRLIRERYPVGTRIELISMDDPYNHVLKPGCKGTVTHVDDVGTVFARWDCGSGLGLVPGQDEFRVIGKVGDPNA